MAPPKPPVVAVPKPPPPALDDDDLFDGLDLPAPAAPSKGSPAKAPLPNTSSLPTARPAGRAPIALGPSAPAAAPRAPIALGPAGPSSPSASSDLDLPAPVARRTATPKGPATLSAEISGMGDDLDLDLPAAVPPASKKAPIAPPVQALEDELDFPVAVAPRAGKRDEGIDPARKPPAAPGGLRAPGAQPAVPGVTAAPGKRPLAPSFGEMDLELSAPASAKRAASSDLDLPAPIPAQRAAAKSGALDLDLPAPATAKRGALDLDLPAPATAKRGALDLDLPAPATAKRGAFDLDLPAPSSGKRGGLDADLPAPSAKRGHLDLDLPAPSGKKGDLPAPAGKGRAATAALADSSRTPFDDDLDLPPPSPAAKGSDLDLDFPPLPASSAAGFGELDLPAAKIADLPAPSRADLPAPSRADLPTPRGADLPAPRAADLPALRGPDLPVPRGISDLPVPRSSNPPGELDDLELPMPPTRPKAHGEVDLGEPGDDMEFADLPQTEGAAPGAAIDSKRSEQGKPKERPASKPASRGGALLAIGVILVALLATGGALTFTPYGAFGIYAIEALLPGAGDPAVVQAAITRADALRLLDDRDHSFEGLALLAQTRRDAGLHRQLLARSLVHESLFQLRFGADAGSAARAPAIRERLLQRGTDPAIALALAADDLRSDNPTGARAHIAQARAHAPDDPFVDLVDGEIALAQDRFADAAQRFRAAAEHGGGAAAQWGLARALSQGAEAALVEAALAATLEASPQHASARVLTARRLWSQVERDESARSEDPREQRALLLASEVTGQAAPQGGPLHAAGSERADAFVLIGSIHERRGRINQARAAFEAASEIEQRRVEALLGAARCLLVDRPTEALARFESVLAIEGRGARRPPAATDPGASPPDPGVRSPRDEAQLGAARAMIALERIDAARAALQQLAERRPRDAEVLLWLGRVEERLDHDAEAEQHYRRAIEADPALFEAYLALAAIQSGSERAQEASQTLAEARLRVRESAGMRRALGSFELSRGRLPEAIVELRRAVELDPALPDAVFSLAIALRRSGHLEEAAQTFERVSELDPGHPGLALERGMLYEARGEAARAVEFYTAALAESPDDPDLLLRLGSAQVIAGHFDQAGDTLARVAELRPTSAEAQHFLGRVAFAHEQYPQAGTHYDRAIALDATRPEYYVHAAWAQFELGNIGQALERTEQALARDPSLGDAYWVRGRVHLRAGAVRDALSDLTRARELRPERIEALADMGDCYDQLRQLPQAIDSYQRAVAARPEEGAWWYRLGRLELDASHRAQAATALERATVLGDARTPQPHWLADAHRLFAEVLVLGGNRAGAAPHYRRYLELSPPDAIDRRDVEDALQRLGQ